MEAVLQNAEPHPLIGQLDLNSARTCEQVAKRDWATFHCATPIVKVGGVDSFSIQVASPTQWCDPTTHALNFTVTNTGSTELEFVSCNPAILFRRLVVRMGGVPVEDIQDFNRLSQLFTVYQSAGKRYQQAQLGFGVRDRMTAVGSAAPLATGPQLFTSAQHLPEKIGPGATRRVQMYLDVSC